MSDASGLAETVQHLWSRAIESGHFRVVRSDACRQDGDWEVVRSFSVIGPRSRPQLLVERGAPAPVARSLLAYPGLRVWRPRLARKAVAIAARANALPRNSIHLQRHRDSPTDASEPLSAIEQHVGHRTLTHVGIRRGANAKATVQIFSTLGEPLGYAKTAWNDLTDHYVQVETRRLQALDGRAGRARVPSIAATGQCLGMPFVVTTPLPDGVQQLRSAEDLTMRELCEVAPIARFAAPGTAFALLSSIERLAAISSDPVVRQVGGPLLTLARAIEADQSTVPITHYDHGDLVPWNTCRDPDGQLWIWDWELSEGDTIGGTDIVHWYLHSVHGPEPSAVAQAVADAGRRSIHAHRALGMGREASLITIAAYALKLGERAVSLAVSHRSWERNRIKESTVLDLVRLGLECVEANTVRPRSAV